MSDKIEIPSMKGTENFRVEFEVTDKFARFELHHYAEKIASVQTPDIGLVSKLLGDTILSYIFFSRDEKE